MEPRLEIHKINISSPDSLDELLNIVIKLLITPRRNPQLIPLINTIKHAHALDPQCLIVQKNVQDPDFLAEHAAYYSQWTTSVPRYCYRLHFFKMFPENEENVLAIIDQLAIEKDSYLGFVTLRPISVSPVAATILKPLPGHFVISRDDFSVNLTGQKFSLAGTPFLQQDNAVGACAQASIWMALRTLRRREGLAPFSPSQITSAATRFLVQGRTLPNRTGLSLEQIFEAIRTAGYSTNVISLRNNNENATPQSLIISKIKLYPYIESGIPVLVVLFPKDQSGHAVLLIGHGWTRNPNTQNTIPKPALDSENNIEIIDASAWASPFYIHNDNTGPYLPLEDTTTDTYSLSDAVMAIPFLPLDIFINADEARETCLDLLRSVLNDIWEDDETNQPPIKVVIRLYLIDRSHFRECVLHNNMSTDVKSYYRLKWLPKKFWLMELNALPNYEASPEGTATRMGEILLDPSSEPEDCAFLSIHLSKHLLPSTYQNGVIFDRDAFNGDISCENVNTSNYSPRLRR